MEEDGRCEHVSVQPQLLQLGVIVRDVVLAERLAHVQAGSSVFPRVAAGMRVVAQVSLKDLVQSLL